MLGQRRFTGAAMDALFMLRGVSCVGDTPRTALPAHSSLLTCSLTAQSWEVRVAATPRRATRSHHGGAKSTTESKDAGGTSLSRARARWCDMGTPGRTYAHGDRRRTRALATARPRISPCAPRTRVEGRAAVEAGPGVLRRAGSQNRLKLSTSRASTRCRSVALDAHEHRAARRRRRHEDSAARARAVDLEHDLGHDPGRQVVVGPAVVELHRSVARAAHEGATLLISRTSRAPSSYIIRPSGLAPTGHLRAAPALSYAA